MALGGVTTGLNTATPSGTSQAGLAPSDFQSIKTTFQTALDSEHLMSASGGANSGAHRLGSARAFYAANSKLSSSDTDGRLFIDSTNSRLHHAGSTNTMLLGGQYTVLGAGNLGVLSLVTQGFGIETAFGRMMNGSTSTVITLANTWVSATPFVQAVTRSTGNQSVGGVPFTAGPISATNQITVYNSSTATAGGGGSASTQYDFYLWVFGVKAL